MNMMEQRATPATTSGQGCFGDSPRKSVAGRAVREGRSSEAIRRDRGEKVKLSNEEAKPLLQEGKVSKE
jgi:hypothetical protein